MRPCSVETHRQQAAEHVPPHKGTCRCRRSRQLHRKAHLYEYILCSLQPCQSQHSNHIERQLHAQRLTHTHTHTHTIHTYTYKHRYSWDKDTDVNQLLVSSSTGCHHHCSFTLHTQRAWECVCVCSCVCVCVCWHRLLAVYSEHLHLMCSEHPSLSHTLTHTHTHTHPALWLTDRIFVVQSGWDTLV